MNNYLFLITPNSEYFLTRYFYVLPLNYLAVKTIFLFSILKNRKNYCNFNHYY